MEHVSKIAVVFTQGTKINEAFNAAISIASKCNHNVWFHFNGVDCVATPTGDTVRATRKYLEKNTDGTLVKKCKVGFVMD